MAVSKKQQKTIDEMNHRVQLCDSFMKDWLLFNQVLMAYNSPGADKTQMENQFLQIKSKLARQHNVLRASLAEDYKLDGNTMNIVSGATNLEAIYSQSEVAVKKLQNEWHRAFISINETLGVLQDKKARAEAGEKIYIAPTGAQAMSAGKGGGMSDGQKKAIIGIVVAAVVIGIMLATGLAQPWIDAFKSFMPK